MSTQHLSPPVTPRAFAKACREIAKMTFSKSFEKQVGRTLLFSRGKPVCAIGHVLFKVGYRTPYDAYVPIPILKGMFGMDHLPKNVSIVLGEVMEVNDQLKGEVRRIEVARWLRKLATVVMAEVK